MVCFTVSTPLTMKEDDKDKDLFASPPLCGVIQNPALTVSLFSFLHFILTGRYTGR